ncbi:MAG TPA: AAA family ATPase [Pararobbsia sp.]|nr:AAA family ATPase [Pararobbsia sp.]
MIQTLAIHNYRSIRDIVVPLARLNVVTGANGTGKSNLYRAMRLLADTARGGLIGPLAREGGLDSVFWAGASVVTQAMRDGEVPFNGRRQGPLRLKLGFSGEHFGYAVTLGLPIPGESAFDRDPVFKTESIWAGPFLRTASVLVERQNAVVRAKTGREWAVLTQGLPAYESLFDQVGRDSQRPEVFDVRETLRNWRFYDHFRTDVDAPARHAQLGTRTTVLHHDGHDLAAAVQTILEIGDHEAFHDAIDDAFPGARVEVDFEPGGLFRLRMQQRGLLRPLTAAELSDGTLRYLLLVAALLTPRPPALMVLNEPESSLHPDLLPALGRLIKRAARASQLWVVTHSTRLAAALDDAEDANTIVLDKDEAGTSIPGQHPLDKPAWYWPE